MPWSGVLVAWLLYAERPLRSSCAGREIMLALQRKAFSHASTVRASGWHRIFIFLAIEIIRRLTFSRSLKCRRGVTGPLGVKFYTQPWRELFVRLHHKWLCQRQGIAFYRHSCRQRRGLIHVGKRVDHRLIASPSMMAFCTGIVFQAIESLRETAVTPALFCHDKNPEIRSGGGAAGSRMRDPRTP